MEYVLMANVALMVCGAVTGGKVYDPFVTAVGLFAPSMETLTIWYPALGMMVNVGVELYTIAFATAGRTAEIVPLGLWFTVID
jgi:hypothetical protein